MLSSFKVGPQKITKETSENSNDPNRRNAMRESHNGLLPLRQTPVATICSATLLYVFSVLLQQRLTFDVMALSQ